MSDGGARWVEVADEADVAPGRADREQRLARLVHEARRLVDDGLPPRDLTS